MVAVELVGNALCLDFVNTVNARPVARRDWLATPTEAIVWLHAVDITAPADDLDALLPAVRDLRDSVYAVFQPLAHGTRPARGDLTVITTTYAEALEQGTLIPGDAGRFQLAWDAGDSRVVRWKVVESAVDLLTRGPLDRIGECPSCGWLFLDTSKNRRRRWCSMATCGSRDKARRYYASHSSG